MKKRIAILDLGTNTFHLLIADVLEEAKFKVLYKAEEFVQLGEQGLERIGEKPFERGLQQIRRYRTVMDEYHPEQIIAFGTAAIRTASNGHDFMEQARAVCPMEVRKISGDEEATLIYLGVKQAVQLFPAPVLMMDIGGGSTEFIIANDDQVFWKQSFPLGASVLLQQFQQHDPATAEEVMRMRSFLQDALQPLFLQQQHYNISRLIGASGSFDTFASMIAPDAAYTEDQLPATAFDFSREQFQQLYQRLLKSNLQERLQMKGMKAFRAAMMVVAAILTDVVVQQFRVEQITQSAYALKEGVLWKLMQQEEH